MAEWISNKGPDADTDTGFSHLHAAAKNGLLLTVKSMINEGANINSVCFFRKTNQIATNVTPLYLAIENYHLDVIELLLNCGADFDTDIGHGKTALNLAVEIADPLAVDTVLNYSPDLNNKSNRSAFILAIFGDKEQYEMIVDSLTRYGYSVKAKDVFKYEIFYNAVEKGYMKIVKDLLAYGADVNSLRKFNGKAVTPLHVAAAFKQFEVAKLLIERGADLIGIDEYGRTTMFYAIINNDVDMVKILVDNGIDMVDNFLNLLGIAIKQNCLKIIEIILEADGIDVNSANEIGMTPLHLVAIVDHVKLKYCKDMDIVRSQVAKLLLDRGADVNARTWYGSTPLQMSVIKRFKKVTEVLLSYNADVNMTYSFNNETCLHCAASIGDVEIAMMLVEHGANINAKSKMGDTPLHIVSDCTKIVKLLLNNRAEVNSRNIKMLTPLHYAAKQNHVSVAELLIMHDADLNTTDITGLTPLHYACMEGHTEIVDLLVKYRVDISIRSEYGHTPRDEAHILTMYPERVNPNRAGNIIVILERHNVMLKTANLFFGKEVKVSRNHLEFIEVCEREIKEMTCAKLGQSKISYYDILVKDISEVAKYARNEEILEVILSNKHKHKFPTFSNFIEGNFRLGLRKKLLSEQFVELFSSVFSINPFLPEHFIYKLSNLLSNVDLRKFILACNCLSDY